MSEARRDPAPGAAEALARLRAEMSGPRFHAFLKPVARSADPEAGSVSISLPYRPDLSFSADQDGFHGGVVASLADIAGHAAVAVRIGRTAPTIDLTVDYLRPAPPPELVAVATILRLGRSIARAEIRIHDAEDRLVAFARGAFSVL